LPATLCVLLKLRFAFRLERDRVHGKSRSHGSSKPQPRGPPGSGRLGSIVD
jgi:hypothetical protein